MSINNKVFVYGSLMQGFWNYAVVEDSVLEVKPGKIKAKLYHLPEGFPAIELDGGEVSGEILTLKDFPNVLRRLDRLEGYHGPNESNLYDRVFVSVQTADGIEEAYCYVWAGAKDYLVGHGIYLPKGDWREFIQSKEKKNQKNSTVYYFAYGSCMCEESFKETVQNYKVLGRAYLDDRKLAFTKYSGKWSGGVGDVVHAPGEMVEGVLYEIEQRDLENLDRREGVPWMYQREVVPVLINGQSVHAVTYVVTQKEAKDVAPTKEYLDTILTGAKGKLSEEYILKIRNVKTRE